MKPNPHPPAGTFSRSQAVRLPKEFRFDTDEVRIRGQGSARVPEPVDADWKRRGALSGGIDADFATAARECAPRKTRKRRDNAFR